MTKATAGLGVPFHPVRDLRKTYTTLFFRHVRCIRFGSGFFAIIDSAR